MSFKCLQAKIIVSCLLVVDDVLLFVGLQADERHRRNAQGSPQAAGAQKQPPAVPPRAETYSNGSASESAQPAMHRPMEPQVTMVTFHLGYSPNPVNLLDEAEQYDLFKDLSNAGRKSQRDSFTPYRLHLLHLSKQTFFSVFLCPGLFCFSLTLWSVSSCCRRTFSHFNLPQIFNIPAL